MLLCMNEVKNYATQLTNACEQQHRYPSVIWKGLFQSKNRILKASVLNLSVPDLFLFWICSAKYSTALQNILIFLKKCKKYSTVRMIEIAHFHHNT